MQIEFTKYQGTGNDFILVDNLSGLYNHLTNQEIQLLCDRRFGIGADGLIRINRTTAADFEVDYFNADGSKSFCGNGARCAVDFAGSIGFDVSVCRFLAIDGVHVARKQGELIALDMLPVTTVGVSNNAFILDTGSPHFVRFVEDVSTQDITATGKSIRYSAAFEQEGINVNLAEILSENELKILTYERGVEAETFSCGTGATACALAEAVQNNKIGDNTTFIFVKGGKLEVSFTVTKNQTFENIQLIGPAKRVFSGTIDLKKG